MSGNVDQIKKWESVEVERSASEAKRRETENLKIADDIIYRYTHTKKDTAFPLEYSYWLLQDIAGKTVVDYGCGLGENSVLIASLGANVIGVDISPELIELAIRRLELHDLDRRAEFRVASAHALPFDDESVDVVFGMAILHHLDLKNSSQEVHRILKKGGRAIFMEPVRNSKMIKFIRSLIPYEQPDISPFERPLTDQELKDYAKDFANYRSRAFSLPFVNLLQVLGVRDSILMSAYRADGKILRLAPFLKHYATIRVVEITK